MTKQSILILLNTGILLSRRNIILSFAGAHWQMNTTLYQNWPEENNVKLNKINLHLEPNECTIFYYVSISVKGQRSSCRSDAFICAPHFCLFSCPTLYLAAEFFCWISSIVDQASIWIVLEILQGPWNQIFCQLPVVPLESSNWESTWKDFPL